MWTLLQWETWKTNHTKTSVLFRLRAVSLLLKICGTNAICERRIREPVNYRLAASPLAYRYVLSHIAFVLRSTDFRAKEILLAVYVLFCTETRYTQLWPRYSNDRGSSREVQVWRDCQLTYFSSDTVCNVTDKCYTAAYMYMTSMPIE